MTDRRNDLFTVHQIQHEQVMSTERCLRFAPNLLDELEELEDTIPEEKDDDEYDNLDEEIDAILESNK